MGVPKEEQHWIKLAVLSIKQILKIIEALRYPSNVVALLTNPKGQEEGANSITEYQMAK